MNRLPTLAILLTASLMAGCVEFLEEPSETTSPHAAGSTTAPGGSSSGSSARASSSSSAKTMTAQETSQLQSGPCSGGAGPFCATKTHWLAGELSLAQLPVTLRSFNGNLDVRGGTAGDWNLTVVLRARGDTEALARSNLENIQFTWDHESGSDHFLTAEAKKKIQNTNNQESATMSLLVPASTIISLTGSTSNGAGTIRGIQGSDLRLSTSNGALTAQDIKTTTLALASSNGAATLSTVTADSIEVDTSNAAITATAAAKDYKFTSSNGAMDLRLRPSASGKLVVASSNGPISVALAEDKSHGYDLSASTSNGVVNVALKDGQSSGGTTSKTFKTTNYSGRTIQTAATITSSNSMITVSPL